MWPTIAPSSRPIAKRYGCRAGRSRQPELGRIALSRLAGKVAIVTGSYSGIGAAVAFRLAREGARVVLGNSNAVAGEATAAAIRSEGGEATAIAFDLASEHSIRNLIASAHARYGGLSAHFAHVADVYPYFFEQHLAELMPGGAAG